MNLDDIKQLACKEIENHGDRLIGVAKDILDNPEPGFQEFKTADRVAKEFESMGIPFEENIGITGLKASLNTRKGSGPNVAVIGELDSLKVLGHPHADPETSAAHACGHHCQIAMMIGVGVGLQAPGVLDSLSGRVTLMAVPAEEYIEVEYRDDLRREGKIEV